MKNFFVVFVVFCFASSAFASEDAAKDEAVVTLTTDSFEHFIQDNEIALVEFYAPWCGHCKRLAPEFEKAAQKLKESSGIPLGKVDATVEDELARKFDVQGYPTLKLFRNGKAEEYKGGRTADTIVSWLEKMTGPAIESVKDVAAAEKIAEAADVAFIGSFKEKDNSAMKTFQSIADNGRLLGKFVSFVSSSAKDEVSVYRKGEGKTGSHPVDKKEDLEKFCSEERFPFFGPINGDNYGDYFGNGRELVWFAGSEEEFEENGKSIRSVAKDVRAKYNFVWLDTDKFKDHAQSSLGVKEFPALVLQSKEARYVYPEASLSKPKKIKAFLEDVVAGKIERSLMSEPIPETNDEAVKVVVGKNFKEMVVQAKKDVMLEVYAPWCGHCKKFEPIYTEFAEKMSANKHIVIAKMDGTTNESPLDTFKWSGFPTLLFVKAGSDTPIPFEGARTLEGLTEFVKEHASKPVEMEAEGKDEL